MIANYGYQDGSGIYLISVDTEKCDGCGKCAEVCPCDVLELVSNEYDPFDDDMVLSVVPEQRNKLKYSCAPCKSVNNKNERRCIQACPREAIRHSW
jgi:Fe-S-cluster-containing hydrogenase component 2